MNDFSLDARRDNLTLDQQAMVCKPPFPWFGGKSRVAPLVWERFGNVPNYVEPFFGSGAVLLGRPHSPRIETVNDKDSLLVNFWRSVRYDPEATAYHADRPVMESELHAVHSWLLNRLPTLAPQVEGNPDFYDAKVAGLWVWGISCWIGSGFCSGQGPWHVDENGCLVNTVTGNGTESGVWRQLPHLGDADKGVNRQLPHLGDAGKGVNRRSQDLLGYFTALGDRLRCVRVCRGDWTRVLGPSVTMRLGVTGVFLDPPYSDDAERHSELYREEDLTVAHAVREWAIENGDNSLFRIAMCGYESEYDMPVGWIKVKWKNRGGYGSQGNGRGRENATREVMWFSPHCLTPIQGRLF